MANGLLAKNGLIVTGSVEVQNAVTASTFSGDGSGLSGVSDFPYTGSAIISGSLDVTGSITSTDTVTAVTGSFSHLKGNSPITIEDSVTFQSNVIGITQYHNRYQVEAENYRSGSTTTTEFYYTAQTEGDGLAISASSNTPGTGNIIKRIIYRAESALLDPNDSGWIQVEELNDDTSFLDGKTAIVNYMKNRTVGTLPMSIKMTWEEQAAEARIADIYSNGIKAAYSIRKLSYNATSSMRVRRSDNVETDIGFDADGNLDTSTLTTFAGTSDCFVVILYDQSGNNLHAETPTSTATSDQPTIVSSGVVLTGQNGKPIIDGTAYGGHMYISPTISLTQPYSAIAVGQVTSAYANILTNIFKTGNGTYSIGNTTVALTGSTAGNGQLWFGAINGSNSYGSVNQGINPQFASSLNPGNVDSLAITNQTYWRSRFKLQETILWTNDQYAAGNETGIKNDINGYYQIY